MQNRASLKTGQNKKARVDLSCPTCGRPLTKGAAYGYVANGETFCCEGCADGTGCTCETVFVKTTYNRPGSRGQRNVENSKRDRNQNNEVDTSGKPIGKRHPTDAAPARYPSRGQQLRDGEKRARSQSETRPSTRTQARGQSEQRGSLNKRLSRSEHIDRIGSTGQKGKS